MPAISRFYGIRVEMFYDDHAPPHFHARYQGGRASFTLDGSILEGGLPINALRLVQEWARLHINELEEDWKLALEHLPLKPIEPLP